MTLAIILSCIAKLCLFFLISNLITSFVLENFMVPDFVRTINHYCYELGGAFAVLLVIFLGYGLFQLLIGGMFA